MSTVRVQFMCTLLSVVEHSSTPAFLPLSPRYAPVPLATRIFPVSVPLSNPESNVDSSGVMSLVPENEPLLRNIFQAATVSPSSGTVNVVCTTPLPHAPQLAVPYVSPSDGGWSTVDWPW